MTSPSSTFRFALCYQLDLCHSFKPPPFPLILDQQDSRMNLRSTVCISMAFGIMLFHCPTVLSQGHSSPAEAGPTINVDSLFHYTASRNQKVITQAVDFVLSMQTAPTCTRMAASHLMSECRLLEHAPDFAKSRPEAYLDNVKTEYAAKLAVCELLSAQPTNPSPPPHCEILVPSHKACGKGIKWWHSKSETPEDKQCYPEFRDHQYVQCLKSLQSTPQFWTSFSNARQNSVVMCQASRDAIERENHLETFKNLTQILGGVTSTMQKTTEDYDSLVREQRRFTEETRDSHEQLKHDIGAVQEKAVATVAILDEKFHTFMETSISELINALASSQNSEIAQIHERMHNFSQELMIENSQLANSFTNQLQQMQQKSLATLQVHHEAQIESHMIISNHVNGVYSTINQTSNLADISLEKANSMAHRLNSLESQTESIADGFILLSTIPALMARLVQGFTLMISVIFILSMLYKIDKRLATYAAGTCSSIFFLHSSGILKWFTDHFLNNNDAAAYSEHPVASHTNNLSCPQGLTMVVLLWLLSFPIYYINQFLGRMVITAFDNILRPLYIRQYINEGGRSFLPSIEIPHGALLKSYNCASLASENESCEYS